MSIKRRNFLQGAAAVGAIGAAAGTGLLAPRGALAARPTSVFGIEKFEDTMKALSGGAPMEPGEIRIKAPDIAENGAVVPVTVDTDIDGIESISIVVENNPSPLAASFDLTPASGGMVSTRLKMGKTTPVHAVVKAGGKVYTASKEVKVTIGGCGG